MTSYQIVASSNEQVRKEISIVSHVMQNSEHRLKSNYILGSTLEKSAENVAINWINIGDISRN